jgi:uncharacterized YccA/Bax inhibitor family protein
MKSNNPFFKTKSYTSRQEAQVEVLQNSSTKTWEEPMTVDGTMNKSFILFAILVATAGVTWYLSNTGFPINLLTIGGGIIGFILVIVASFKPHLSEYLAPAYAFFKGFFIGGISIYFETMFPGIVIQAISATLVTFVVCFLLYRFGIVKVNQTFKSVVIAATLAIFTYYIISFLLSITGLYTPIHYGNSMMSIGISIFVIIIAALNLFLDFDNIESGVLNQQPKFMEWFGAMGLMITLVWLYIEFLRLLSKLASRD